MDDTGPYHRMLASLRQTFQQRLPAGLTSAADARLRRTLSHYVSEVARVKGTIDEQEVLRESFDSMASWFRRNTSQLSPVFRQGAEAPRPPPADSVAYAVSPESGSGLDMIGRLPMPMPSPIAVPELARADAQRSTREFEQLKDVLQKMDDVSKYRDTEINLVLNSKDRDWLTGPTSQNRYNFAVQLDTTRPQGTGAVPTLVQRLRNIVRIEFVKAILPVESLRMVIPRACSTDIESCAATPNASFYSVLALPSITVNLDEHQGNNIGTNNAVDRSLAICQYDATWRSDHHPSFPNSNRGYTLFIPKFMKAQRIYAPTPLANFQRLTFQLLDPENQLLSTAPDSSKIAHIVWGSDTSGSCYSGTVGNVSTSDYLFIQTTEYFPVWTYSQLDTILFDGIQYAFVDDSLNPAARAFMEWIQAEAGHVVVGTAYGTWTADTSAPVSVTDGANDCGYANFIIIRNRFAAPTETGECEIDYFAGNTGLEAEFAEQVRIYPSANQQGGVLNLSRQVQLTLRVITRDMDSASNLRPDNV